MRTLSACFVSSRMSLAIPTCESPFCRPPTQQVLCLILRLWVWRFPSSLGNFGQLWQSLANMGPPGIRLRCLLECWDRRPLRRLSLGAFLLRLSSGQPSYYLCQLLAKERHSVVLTRLQLKLFHLQQILELRLGVKRHFLWAIPGCFLRGTQDDPAALDRRTELWYGDQYLLY